MSQKDTIKRCSIVVLGNLNPAILHPEWFDRYKILPAQEVRGIAEKDLEVVKELGDLKVKFAGSNIFVSGVNTRLNLPSFRIQATPDRFEASTTLRDKRKELCTLVAETFKILEHTPVTALGINFLSVLRFSRPSKDLMKNYFCTDESTLSSIFGNKFIIDGRVRYEFMASDVTLTLEDKENTDEIGISFNYDKKFSEGEGAKELTVYLIEKFEPSLQNAVQVIKQLFGEPETGERKSNAKSSTEN